MANSKKWATQHLETDIPAIDISLDRDAFDVAIHSQGVNLVHHKAFRCPVGMTDINDNRRPHEDHVDCQGGFVYKAAGSITGLFIGNSKSKRMEDSGFADNSTAQVSFPTDYDEGDEAFTVAPFDRFYINEESLLVPMWQLFTHHESGIDRLKYPVEKVEFLMDNKGQMYHEGSDFVVKAGTLHWIGTNRPPNQIDSGPGMGNGFGNDHGAVCSIRYHYRPYYYVGQVLHDIRVAQIQDGTERKIQRMPQSVILLREYISQNQEATGELESNSSSSSDVLRQMMAPFNGGFGSK